MALALALKYRPLTFSTLVGQESVAKTLSLALQGDRIAHAYLFSGLRGSGKTSSARIFARALQCEKAPIADPCNTCDNCRQSLEGRHLDIIEIDGASNRKIEDIRSTIEQTRYAPSYGRFKIFIIDEVHMLTKEAFNALLKTLEEPPSYVKFILATTDPLKLPATILSRTQHFRFKKIPQRAVIEHLYAILGQENISYEKEAIDIIARSGNGSLRDTLTLTEQAISYCNANITRAQVTEMLGAIDPAILQGYFDALTSLNQESINQSLAIFEDYEAEMILDEMMLYLKDRIQTDSRLSMLMLDRYLRIIAEAKQLLNLNCESSFTLLLTTLKMQEAQKYNHINDEIKQLESKIAQSTPTRVATAPTMPQAPQASHSAPHTSPIAPQTSHPSAQSPNTHVLFDELIAKIYDRSAELGEAFESSIHFISFENHTLTWHSQPSPKAKELLTTHYSSIKNFVQELFGIETKIVQTHSTPNTPPTPDIAESTPPTPATQPQADSMATISPTTDSTTMTSATPTPAESHAPTSAPSATAPSASISSASAPSDPMPEASSAQAHSTPLEPQAPLTTATPSPTTETSTTSLDSSAPTFHNPPTPSTESTEHTPAQSPSVESTPPSALEDSPSSMDSTSADLAPAESSPFQSDDAHSNPTMPTSPNPTPSNPPADLATPSTPPTTPDQKSLDFYEKNKTLIDTMREHLEITEIKRIKK